MAKKTQVEIDQERTEAFYRNEKLFVLESDTRNKEETSLAVDDENDIEEVRPFNEKEIEDVVKILPNGKSAGLGGVVYEDIKREFSSIKTDIVGIFNTSLKNRKVPSEWKHDIVQRIPKKNYNREDLTTLRDISLSSVIYKLFSLCIINRILPFIEPQIEFWQRAFLEGRNRQDLIFSLKTALDDFRHISTKLHILFIDFADAFGSIKHEEITTTLREYNIPTVYCKIIEHIYDRSSFQVICGNNLTQKIYITRGTKTGDPLSVMIFLVIVDKVLKPAFSHALVSMNIENERKLRPIPIQAYADDIAMDGNI